MRYGPIVKSSRVVDTMISLREACLNYIAGVSSRPVINQANQAPSAAPTADLVTVLAKNVAGFISAAMTTTGDCVNYDGLRESKVFAQYREEFLIPLRIFDPRSISSPKTATAFWINLYNALVLDAVIAFDVRDSLVKGKLDMMTFFRRAAYEIGGQHITLDDIEHGILRGNRGSPFIPGPHFRSDDPRFSWVLPLDSRIHFTLNCGGRSCPPFRAYEAGKLHQQLNLAAGSFIDGTVEVHPETNQLVLSQIFRWYAADFGGREGIIRLLLDYLPDGKRRRYLHSESDDYDLVFTPYDWQLNAI